jgi:hypothetical protein
MKITASKDFGTAKKPLLPLVPEPTKIVRKEDLTSFEIRTVPTDGNSTKVKLTFKVLHGSESTREIIQWRTNVDRALVGLNSTTGTDQHHMMQQFARGTALSTYNANVASTFNSTKDMLAKHKQTQIDEDARDNAGGNAAALRAELATINAYTQTDVLALAQSGPVVVVAAINLTMANLMPTKILQRVKRYLRREARKPVDMTVRQYLMHVLRINGEEIPRLPPNFDATQSLSDDEIADILLFGTPKSWQREMDRQGFDPMTASPSEVVDFMEQIETSEDFDGDKKVVTPNSKKSSGTKNKASNGNSESNDSKYCMLHGKNNTHNTDECKTLKADVKKRKGNDSNGSKNKTWKNSKDNSADASKKELAALTKKLEKLSKKVDLNAIEKKEPVRKRKVNYPTASDEEAEMDLAAIDAELKNFNYGDLDQMDIKEDGEISVTDEISV